MGWLDGLRQGLRILWNPHSYQRMWGDWWMSTRYLHVSESSFYLSEQCTFPEVTPLNRSHAVPLMLSAWHQVSPAVRRTTKRRWTSQLSVSIVDLHNFICTDEASNISLTILTITTVFNSDCLEKWGKVSYRTESKCNKLRIIQKGNHEKVIQQTWFQACFNKEFHCLNC